MQDFSNIAPHEAASKLSTSLNTGLSPSDAAARLRQYGPNQLSRADPESLVVRFLKQFLETLILLLLLSAFISFLMGNLEDAFSISIAVTIVVTVGFIQEYRSEKSLQALEKLVPHSANVIRCRDNHAEFSMENISDCSKFKETPINGIGPTEKVVATTIPATHLVVGDLVVFKVGDRIPADIKITKAIELSVDESSLTGENEPVPKSEERHVKQTSGNVDGTDANLKNSHGVNKSHNDHVSIAYMGTLVQSGYGQGLVVGTAGNTKFGAISSYLQEIESPRTPLQLAMDQLGKNLSYMSLTVIFFIMIIGLLREWKFLDMFQIGVSLAVAAIPEGLPIIVTVTLALGVFRMSRRNAIVKRLPSVETLGSVNMICTDKTGECLLL